MENLDETPGLPGYVCMELMQGCRNKAEMTKVCKTIEKFDIYWPNYDDCNRAMKVFQVEFLSNNLGIFDALIGECSVGLNAVLCTFNEKHYSSIPDLFMNKPYSKINSA